MVSVKGLGLLLLLVALPTATAEEPEDAAAEWNDAYGDQHPDAVLGLEVEPRHPREGQQFVETLRLDPGLAVDNVTYQMCDVGHACFILGFPVEDLGDGVWRLDTAQEWKHSRFLDEGDLRTFEGGQRIGVQFLIGLADGTTLEFPLADSCLDAPDDAYVACEEHHYFAVDIQEARSTPFGVGGCCVSVLVALALAGVLRRG